jgi:hypothetical protein
MKLLPHHYNCIGILAKHCDLSKLCIAETEALNFDLAELFCDVWIEIENIIKEVQDYISNPDNQKPEYYNEKNLLLNGGYYVDCSNKQRRFEGIYKIMAYYSYSRYIVINGFNDTANGIVTKTNEFSIPKTLKELELFSDKYRNMGKISFERTLKYLCANKDIFDYYKCSEDTCGCNSDECGTTKAKGYGFKTRNISK